VICDERFERHRGVAAGRINLLVSLRGSRPGIYSSFVVTHGREGSTVRPVHSTVLPASARMSVSPDERYEMDEARRQRSQAQSLQSYYQEPRPPSVVVRNGRPKAPPPGVSTRRRSPPSTANSAVAGSVSELRRDAAAG